MQTHPQKKAASVLPLQTKFMSMCVPAHDTVELKLFALLYKPGVYDLKRYVVATLLVVRVSSR